MLSNLEDTTDTNTDTDTDTDRDTAFYKPDTEGQAQEFGIRSEFAICTAGC